MKFSITKTIDNLGRIVIPKELRNYYGFSENQALRLIPTDAGVLIVKDVDIKVEEISTIANKKHL